MISKKDGFYELSFRALGTNCFFKVSGECEKVALKRAKREVKRLEKEFSVFKKGSDVSRLNRESGKFVKLSKEAFSLIFLASYYSKITEGFFDVTIRPLVRLWSIGKKDFNIPLRDDVEHIKALVDYRFLTFNEASSEVMLRKNQEIDLGGIAKGYIADVVKDIFLEMKIKSAIINLGGNVIVIGNKEKDELWNVAIKNPLEPNKEPLMVVKLKDKSIVTSGSYERFSIKDNKFYSHIINPKTGYPVNSELLSVTIISDKSIDGDGLSTALYILGVEKSLKLLKDFNLEGILVTKSREVIVTNALEGKVILMKNSFEIIYK